jgi:hypothetical protein
MKYYSIVKMICAGSICLSGINLAHAEQQPNVNSLDAASPTLHSDGPTTSTKGTIKGVSYSSDACHILAKTEGQNSNEWLRTENTTMCNAATVAFYLGSKVGLNTKYSPGGWGWYYTSIWISNNL